MGNGILSERGRGRAFGSLGSSRPFFAGLGAAVPGNCWDVPGFKDCNDQGWVVAERKCIQEGLADQQYGGDWKKCKEVQAADYAYFGCVLRLCPPTPPVRPTSSGGWTWRNTTPNPSVKTFQQHLNTALTREGYKNIDADGRLGPATCGAFNFVGGLYPELFKNDPIENIGICQSFTNPTKIGKSKPEPSPTSEEARALDADFGGLPWMHPDSRAPQLQNKINVELDDADMLPIPVSGQLDAEMCGAMDFLDKANGSLWYDTWGPRGMARCPAHVAPRKKPKTPAPAPAPSPIVPVPPAPTPGPAPTPVAPVAAASLLGGGILLALGIGAYAYYKHKTGGA